MEIQRYKGSRRNEPRPTVGDNNGPRLAHPAPCKIEDAYEADEIFSTLMGDEVEPRRRFIEENALAVKNLDI